MHAWATITWILLGLNLGPIVLAVLTWRQSRVPGARELAAVMFASAVYVGCSALEASPALQSYVLLLKDLEFVGIVLFPPLTACASVDFTGHGDWLPRPVRVGLFGFAGFNLAMKAADPWLHLVHRETTQATGTGGKKAKIIDFAAP